MNKLKCFKGGTTNAVTLLGVALILVGVALVVLPMVGRYIDLSRIPWWIVYVYQSNGFYFVTSPLLLLLSLITFIIYIVNR